MRLMQQPTRANKCKRQANEAGQAGGCGWKSLILFFTRRGRSRKRRRRRRQRQRKKRMDLDAETEREREKKSRWQIPGEANICLGSLSPFRGWNSLMQQRVPEKEREREACITRLPRITFSFSHKSLIWGSACEAALVTCAMCASVTLPPRDSGRKRERARERPAKETTFQPSTLLKRHLIWAVERKVEAEKKCNLQ